jgi:hypothetical protein
MGTARMAPTSHCDAALTTVSRVEAVAGGLYSSSSWCLPGDSRNLRAEEGIRCFDAGSTASTAGYRVADSVLEPVDHQEVDELLAPLAVDTK